jgi:hypothetical protein
VRLADGAGTLDKWYFLLVRSRSCPRDDVFAVDVCLAIGGDCALGAIVLGVSTLGTVGNGGRLGGVLASTLGSVAGSGNDIGIVSTLGTATASDAVLSVDAADVFVAAGTSVAAAGVSGAVVQRCSAVATCRSAFRVGSPAAREGIIVDGGLVSNDIMSSAAWCKKSLKSTSGIFTEEGKNTTVSVCRSALVLG